MDPIERIFKEVEGQDSLEALAFLYRLITGSTEEEFLGVRDEIIEKLDNESLIDPLERIFRSLAFQAQQNVLLMRCASKYLSENSRKLKPIDIEPTHWLVTLLGENREQSSVTVKRDLSDDSGGQTKVLLEDENLLVPVHVHWYEYYNERLDGLT